MDREREKNSEQREIFVQQRHDSEKKAIGLLLKVLRTYFTRADLNRD
jgi:hypothetical protein